MSSLDREAGNWLITLEYLLFTTYIHRQMEKLRQVFFSVGLNYFNNNTDDKALTLVSFQTVR
jgi:hypothetical protein